MKNIFMISILGVAYLGVALSLVVGSGAVSHIVDMVIVATFTVLAAGALYKMLT